MHRLTGNDATTPTLNVRQHPRTVGYHVYKAYPKLGVSSRTELHRLPLTGG